MMRAMYMYIYGTWCVCVHHGTYESSCQIVVYIFIYSLVFPGPTFFCTINSCMIIIVWKEGGHAHETT